MKTVPNQNIITIHRDKPKNNFLQIKNENWQDMLKETNDYYALALYLYLACNMDNYELAVSPAAIHNTIGMARSTYYKKMQLLKDHGYIIEGKGNRLEFYETPIQEKNVNSGLPETQCGLSERQGDLSQKQQNLSQKQIYLSQEQNCTQENKEIDIYNTDNINIENNNRQSQQQRSNRFIF